MAKSYTVTPGTMITVDTGTHPPPWQICPVGQAIPQPPQFAFERSGSTQKVPHAIWPGRHPQVTPSQ